MNQKLDMKKIITYATEFCNEEPSVFFQLRRLRSYDVHLYMQAIRTAYFSMELAKGLNMTEKEQKVLYRSALLLDVGKMQQNTSLLLKHPISSVELLHSLIMDGLIDGDAIMEHHENLDGTGYPKGLNWERITLSGRILRIADSFASMLSFDREGGEVSDIANALEELYRWSDMMYDSDLVDLLAFYYSPTLAHPSKNGAMFYL
jgi:HD-GYP domain-containing protein (c-di-GMP phosphodiesterase class II)